MQTLLLTKKACDEMERKNKWWALYVILLEGNLHGRQSLKKKERTEQALHIKDAFNCL